MMTTVGKIMVLALICGLLLSTTYQFSRSQIAQNQQAFELQQLTEVVGDPDISLVPIKAGYQLLREDLDIGQLRALSTFEGYNGEIRFWLATTLDGEILGVRIIEHQETPGLGDKLDLAVSNWVLDFEGTSLETRKFDVKKYGGDFDQFSGATITPRAVVTAIAETLENDHALKKGRLK